MQRIVIALLSAGITLISLIPGVAVTAGTTQRVSVTSTELEAHGDSTDAVVTDNGRFVAFASAAPDIVAGDTNGKIDIFVRDRLTGTTERVSVDSAGAQALGGDSIHPAISADGRFVAFSSKATNLVANDTNDADDIFVRDRTAGTTERVSLGDNEEQATGGGTDNPDISGDGRYVVFQSNGIPFPNPSALGRLDIFVRDRTLGTTELVSISDSEEQASGGGSANPTISDDGNLIAFESTANNLSPADASVHSDIFLRNRTAATTTLVSVSSAEVQSNYINDSPVISANGGFVAFISGADNLVPNDPDLYDVFVRDLSAGTTELVTVTSDEQHMAGGDARSPAISADGRFVAFDTHANNLDATDTVYTSDVFVRDRLLGTTERISVDSNQEVGDNSFNPSLSADGGVVAFESQANGLVSDDTNGNFDAFVHAYDLDADGVADWVDNCPTVANTDGQAADADGDWAGDACDHAGTGNADCNQAINAVDALKLLRYVAGLSVAQSEPCKDIGEVIGSGFKQGDVDCNGSVNAVDALKVLRAVAALSVVTSCAGPVLGPS